MLNGKRVVNRMNNTVYAINGPVIKVKASEDFSMLEKVYVGPKKLIGEVIAISQKETTIQVYESTTGLKKGDPVFKTSTLMSVVLGPGILGNIFDGIQRPLSVMAENDGIYITSGSQIDPLDMEKKWDITWHVKEGDGVEEGMILASTQETESISHKFMVPKGFSGTIKSIHKGKSKTLKETLCDIELFTGEIKPIPMIQEWPIKIARPIQEQLNLTTPLITGQRVIDTFFPIAKGGTAAIPGGFGAGKTMLQHQLAKWSDADIIVYVGCGERGNEMTQVLEEFKELVDPRTANALMERTVLIANTSNMPVAAREASIYTGITLAEYYRDMGYHVALMADSTSRWAEALREISGRLEEMPAEEGFPAYLPSRIALFYERAGRVKTLAGSEGSVSIIGAVSPQGSDFSEPVTQNTKRFVRSFWALDKTLAYQRHYPSVNWQDSYSEYIPDLKSWYNAEESHHFLKNRQRLRGLLAEEDALMEIVRLVGKDMLPDDQKLILEIGRVIRLGFLQQNAFHKEDMYVPLKKQAKMMEMILYLYDQTVKKLSKNISLITITSTGIFDALIKMKYTIANNYNEDFNELKDSILNTIESIE